ncbi:DUF1308 domain-containing protein [Entomomonas asaccharolytica]|uniref:DUF1308 domain-containing protein n=1 Tax=Entomomonas asaccharolytica TaxID=2785331 RepID=A0A974NFA5_9GAMM|nr:DUF1308 domain-containing protein [Entomomonas asaccharolytica]QQP85529.1 DUF1308 domain-containing protein [Entomomonas asaccharolytica]
MAMFGFISVPQVVQHPDEKKIFNDFSNSIASYKEWSDSFWTGWAVATNQKFQVGDKVVTQGKDDNDSVEVITKCSLQETSIVVIHCFDTARFIPIKGTPVRLTEAVKGAVYGYNDVKGAPIFAGHTDDDGKFTAKGCESGKNYRVTFYPNVTEQQVETLYNSYKGVIADLRKWLEGQWNDSFATKWKEYTDKDLVGQMKEDMKAVWRGIISVLEDMWKAIKLVFDIIANPLKYAEKIKKFFVDTDWEKVYNSIKDGLAQALVIAQDKGLMFILVCAIISWFQLLPPQDLIEVKSALVTEFIIGLLVGVVLTGGAGLAVRFGSKVFTKASNSRGAVLLRDLANRIMDIFSNKRLSGHADNVKPAVFGKGADVKPVHNNKVDILDDTTTRKVDGTNANKEVDNAAVIASKADNNTSIGVETKNPTPNHNEVAKTPDNKPADGVNKTCTNNCPVSMVTGEELLTLTDGTLEGLIPFNWTRLYRTSAAEINTGLGYGWSHSLSHNLQFKQQQVIWTDHENRQTSLPLPTEQCPAYSNNLANAAIYLGNKPNEYILVQAGEQKGFYHFTRTKSGAQLDAISDNYGNKLYINRDLTGKIKRIHNGAGRGLLVRYQGLHITGIDYQKQIAANTEEESWQTIQPLVSYQYNEQQQLIKATNAANESEHYSYDQLNVIQERCMAGGAAFYWEWQGAGKNVRCIRHWANFDQMEARYDWDDNGTVTVTRKDGSQLVYTHDENAKLIKQIDAAGGETLKDYDENGNLIAERNPLGAETFYEYDEYNRLSAIYPPEAEPTFYFYSWGFIRKIKQGEAEWFYKNNEQGNIIEQEDPQGNITKYSYTPEGKIKAIHYPDGSRHEFTWNRLGQLIEEELPQGGIRRYRYDSLGRQIIWQDERNQTTQYEYDPVGRVSKITYPNGTSQSYRYNAYGKVTQVTDEQGRITRYDYAQHLHLISKKTNPDGSTVQYQYNNTELNLTDIINEQGERYHLDYYPSGLISQEIGFDGRKTSYQYDVAGNLIAKTDYDEQGKGYTTTYLRSPQGKLIQKTLPDGKKYEYWYNSLGLLARIDDEQWPLNYEYDITGKLTAEYQGWATIRYQYSPLGILSQCKLPDGNIIDYKYNRGGQLAHIELNNQKLTSHYYSLGKEVERQQGSLTSQYDYDEQGRLKAHFVNHQTKALYQRKYQYNVNGNLSAIEDSRKGIRQYYYDPLDRLIQVRGDISEDLIHDPAGNLLAQERQIQQANIKGNRLLMQGDKHFTYDAFGNLIQERRGQAQKLITNYEYDCQHQLKKATLPDGTVATYQYDVFGRRISKTVIDKTGTKTKTEFIWQGEKLLAESSKNYYQSYLYELGTFKPLALLKGKGKNAEIYYYQLDHLGTPQELTNSNGTIAWSAKYRAYGNLAVIEANEIAQPLRFQGQYHDIETGLYYNRNRYYSPDIGRYITLDPIKLAGGLNSYQYCPNPINWIDPLGLNACPPDSKDSSVTPETKAAVDAGEPELVNIDTGTANAFVSQDSPVRHQLKAQVEGKEMVMTETAKGEFENIVSKVGGPLEQERARNFMDRVTVIPDDPSERSLRLITTKSVGDNDKIIFGTGDKVGATTMTSDAKFVRGASSQGVDFDVIVHDPVPLKGQ